MTRRKDSALEQELLQNVAGINCGRGARESRCDPELHSVPKKNHSTLGQT
jgi:hypothetical protein